LVVKEHDIRILVVVDIPSGPSVLASI
jgi:hypothetical protein